MARSKVWTGSVWAYEDDVVSSENTFKPVIDVTAPIGTSITVSNGSIGFTRTSTEEVTRFDIPSWGTWTVKPTGSAERYWDTIEVDTVKIYTLTLKVLPAIYQEVQYIQSNPVGQYNGPRIDTGFKPDSNTKVEMDIEIDQASEIQHFLYAYSSNSARFGLLQVSGKYRFDFASALTSSSFNLTTGRHTLELYKGAKIDESTFGTSGATFSVNANLYLLGGSYGGSDYTSYTKLYSARVHDNGTLIRDFVPCYRISDNEVGLYDIVNRVFYTNDGSGTLTEGPDVNQGGNV